MVCLQHFEMIICSNQISNIYVQIELKNLSTAAKKFDPLLKVKILTVQSLNNKR